VTTTKRALQVGWRLQGTSALRRLGYEVDILIDGGTWDWYAHPGWPGESETLLFTQDFNSSEHLAFTLNRLARTGPAYDAVVGFDEYALMPAWQAASMLGRPGPDWRIVANMRDKSAQKGILGEGGIACARWWLIDDIRRQRDEVLALSNQLPLVLKPYSGAATVDTFVARSVPQLRDAAERLAASSSRMVMAETYIAGTEHHADGVVHEGSIGTFSLGEYQGNLIQIGEGMTPASIAVSPAAAPQEYQEARELISRALSLLGLQNGVFHAELFLTASGWVFSEVAMRVGGGGISLHHQVMCDLDLHESMVRAQVGLPPQPSDGVAQAASPVTGWTFLPGPPGIVRNFPPREEILKQEGVLDVEINTRLGQKLGPSTADTFTRVATAVISAPTRTEFIDRQQSLVEWFRPQVIVDSD